MRAVHRVRVAPASRSTALSAARALRPAFPTAIRFQPQSSSPLRFTSTQSTPLAATAAAAPPPSAAAATKPPAKRAPHVVTPSQSEVVDRFGDPPPMTGQVVRASKTHIALESPTGEVLWEMPWTAVHTISLTVDGAAKQKYWTLHEKQTHRLWSDICGDVKGENEVRGMSTSLDEAAKQGGQITFLCYTDLKSHFLRKYGAPAAPEPRVPKRGTKLRLKPGATPDASADNANATTSTLPTSDSTVPSPPSPVTEAPASAPPDTK